MAKIIMGNVMSKIEGLSTRNNPAVARKLAVETPGYRFSKAYKSGQWDGMTRFFSSRDKTFPTGLLSDVLKALKGREEYELIDNRTPVIDYDLPDEITLADGDSHITLRDYQYDAVKKALIGTRGVINVATNGGKTEIACGIIKCILPHLKPNQRIVFFTHTKEIFTQSRDRLEERLGMKIGAIGSGLWEPEQVTIAMIPTIQKYTEKPKTLPKNKKHEKMKEEASILQDAYKKTDNSDKKKELKQKVKDMKAEIKAYETETWEGINQNVAKTNEFLDSIVGFLGDEVHHASSDTWYKVFMTLENAYYRFGLTGTIDTKEEINVRKLFGCTGKVISRVSNDYLIEQGHSAKPTINMLKIDARVIQDVNYADARDKGIINNIQRNRIFVNKIIERAKFEKQCLIIVNETKHGEIIEDMLKNSGFTVKFTHGDRTDKFRAECLRELKSGSLQILIATTILDEGVDVSGINCLFLMSGGKSMRQVLQRVGRGLRKKSDGSGVEVYDALDYHNSYLVEHTLERYNTYKKEGFEIVKV